MTRSHSDLRLHTLLADTRLLVILFVAFRLMMLVIYQPLRLEGVERGLGVGGDALYYYSLASFIDDGLLPFRDWWHEFPPIVSHLFVTVKLLTGDGDHTVFTTIFGLLMLVFDVGNLLLVRRIGARLHGPSTGLALGWIYALLLAPAVFIWWNFEPMVVFWTLLGLAWLLEKRHTRSAVAVLLGALTKFTPAVLIGAVWRFRSGRTALRYTLIVVGGFVLVYALFFARNAAMTLPSLTAQMNKASYQTVWALLDGNYRTGNFGTIESHLDPTQANILYGKVSVIPGVVRLALAGAFGLFVFVRTRRFDDRGLVAFVMVTLLVFFLQSQGWSPQWLAQIIPFALLCFPSRDGVLTIILLSALVFAEYPLLFLRTGDTNGEITGNLVLPFALLVINRTLLLVAYVFALYRILRQEPVDLSAESGS